MNIFKKGIIVGSMLAVAFTVVVLSTESVSATSPMMGAKKDYYIRIDSVGKADLWGNVTEVNSSSFKVTSWGGVWTINVGSTTDIRRKYDGKGNLSEFMVGDRVQVKGRMPDVMIAIYPQPLVINATYVKNDAIQTKDATFTGKIGTTTSSGFSFTTNARGNLNVIMSSTTKIYTKQGKLATTTAGIVSGAKAQVEGVWNRQATSLQVRVIKLK